MSLLLLVLGCDQGPWTVDAALRPTLERLDVDHSGAVDRIEYQRVAFSAPPFEQVDQDGSGTLSVSELADLLYRQDPFTFFTSKTTNKVSRPEPSTDLRVHTTLAWRTLESLREELAAARPDAVLPTDERLAAVAAEGLESGPGAALLMEFQTAYAEAGLAFPAGLLPDPKADPDTLTPAP